MVVSMFLERRKIMNQSPMLAFSIRWQAWSLLSFLAFLMTRFLLRPGRDTMATTQTVYRAVRMARMMNQNQRVMYIFSLMMLSPSTQRASNFMIVPDDPYLWKVHFVTLGKTYKELFKFKNRVMFSSNFTSIIGSDLSSSSMLIKLRTSVPQVIKTPPRKVLTKYIWPITLTKLRISQKKYLLKNILLCCYFGLPNQNINAFCALDGIFFCTLDFIFL